MIKNLLLLFSFIFIIPSFGQDKKEKPKVGVVLSGGGAKGLAHIGVLKVLEEAGVEVSYIGGTSMGAIIGGLYACGYSADELAAVFHDLDPDAMIRDFTPRTSKNFYEKRNDETYALTLPFNNFKIAIPTALSKGLYNYNIVSRLTDPVREIRDFSKLPIPFVCIATDVETGEEVVLKEGILSNAILASGAFPSLYSPVEIDGRLLIDGGVVNNYPVEEVRKMGADIIIGVDVQDDLKDWENIKGATGILVQINNYQMLRKMDEKCAITDIYIKPDIKGYTVVSFEDGSEIIKRGEEAARYFYDKIEEVGSGQAIIKPEVKRRDSLFVERIMVNKLNNYTSSYVIGRLGFKSGSKITFEEFNTGINNLNATQNFNTIAYTTEKGKEGGDIINIQLAENPVNTYLKFGLHYDGLYKSALLVNLTQKNLFFRNDAASLDIILGDNFRYNFNYYKDNGFYISYGINSSISSFNKNIQTDFNNGEFLGLLNLNALNIDFFDFTNQAYIQTIFAQKFLIGAGAEFKHLTIKSKTVQNNTSVFDNSNYFSGFGFLKYDSYDNRYFPKKGVHFYGESKSYLFSSDYTNQFNRFTIIKAEAGAAKKLYKNLTLKVQAETGFSIGNNTIPFFDFILGGYGYYMTNNFRHFYGYDFLSLSGNSYLKGLFEIDYEFIKKNHINFSGNFANIGNNIYDDGSILSLPSYSGFAVGYGMETIIGPIEIKHNWSPETKDHYTWFSIGFWF